MIDTTYLMRHLSDALVDDSLQSGKAIRFTIPTSSMAPLVPPGAQVVVRAARPEELRLGDLVLIRTKETRIVHRLIEWRNVPNGRMLVTKGDNSYMADAPWSTEQLGGIIVLVEHEGARLNLLSPWVRGSSAILALLSRGESWLFRATAGLFQRVMLKAFRVTLHAMTRLVFGLAKETIV
jgi:signal peptidase I